MASTNSNMKKITFILSLVSATLTVTAASAAVQNQEDVVNLPAYKVTANRYTEAEKSIQHSLAALRHKAQPSKVSTELPSLNIVVQPTTATAETNFAKIAVPPVTVRS